MISCASLQLEIALQRAADDAATIEGLQSRAAAYAAEHARTAKEAAAARAAVDARCAENAELRHGVCSIHGFCDAFACVGEGVRPLLGPCMKQKARSSHFARACTRDLCLVQAAGGGCRGLCRGLQAQRGEPRCGTRACCLRR